MYFDTSYTNIIGTGYNYFIKYCNIQSKRIVQCKRIFLKKLLLNAYLVLFNALRCLSIFDC